ncbi:hypothetical protein UFOVP219_11 [uncultured Caudovirales phage]|uniref:Uncharacterized protein n=1 Tax=uncultured Caudovirales phage TaxID=2100421 RepID=A0A6J7WSW8_9CAUD|nr:hypothetical protein UFOVP219_11 [uncultured Caudovirales phage]
MTDQAEVVRNYYRRQGVKFERNRILTQIEMLVCFEFTNAGKCKHPACKTLTRLKTTIESVSLFETAAKSAPVVEDKNAS